MPWDKRGPRKGPRLSRRLHDAVLAKQPQCRLAIPGRCTGKSTEVDHIIDVEDTPPGVNPHRRENLQGVCHACHEYKSAVNSQRRSVAKQNEWKRRPERHPDV